MLKKLFSKLLPAPQKETIIVKTKVFVPSGFIAYFYENNSVCIVAQKERQAKRFYLDLVKKRMENKTNIGKKINN